MIWLVWVLDRLIVASIVYTGQMSINDALMSYYIGQPMRCGVGGA